VQAEQDHSDPVRETRWLQTVADGSGFPHAIIAYADLSAPQDRLEALLEPVNDFPIQTAVRGPRRVSQMPAELLRHAEEESVQLSADQARAS